MIIHVCQLLRLYWANYGKIQIKTKEGKRKPLTSFEEYITYRGLSKEINNKNLIKRRTKSDK